MTNTEITESKTPNLKYHETLRESVFLYINDYLANSPSTPSNIYEMVIDKIEAAMIKCALNYTHFNKSEAARLLGLSRGTFYKLLKKYHNLL